MFLWRNSFLIKELWTKVCRFTKKISFTDFFKDFATRITKTSVLQSKPLVTASVIT